MLKQILLLLCIACTQSLYSLSHQEALAELGFAPQSNPTEEEIHKAYKKMALLHHPDRNGGTAEANAKFQNIGNARDVLIKQDEQTISLDDIAEWLARFARAQQAQNPEDILRKRREEMRKQAEAKVLRRKKAEEARKAEEQREEQRQKYEKFLRKQEENRKRHHEAKQRQQQTYATPREFAKQQAEEIKKIEQLYHATQLTIDALHQQTLRYYRLIDQNKKKINQTKSYQGRGWQDRETDTEYEYANEYNRKMGNFQSYKGYAILEQYKLVCEKAKQYCELKKNLMETKSKEITSKLLKKIAEREEYNRESYQSREKNARIGLEYEFKKQIKKLDLKIAKRRKIKKIILGSGIVLTFSGMYYLYKCFKPSKKKTSEDQAYSNKSTC